MRKYIYILFYKNRYFSQRFIILTFLFIIWTNKKKTDFNEIYQIQHTIEFSKIKINISFNSIFIHLNWIAKILKRDIQTCIKLICHNIMRKKLNLLRLVFVFFISLLFQKRLRLQPEKKFFVLYWNRTLKT